MTGHGIHEFTAWQRLFHQLRHGDPDGLDGGQYLCQLALVLVVHWPVLRPDAFNGGVDNIVFESRPVEGGGSGAVPELASWAMLIAGFDLAGGAMRRRRSTWLAV
jgi:hypothetical protein